jgi:hypothetical protein
LYCSDDAIASIAEQIPFKMNWLYLRDVSMDVSPTPERVFTHYNHFTKNKAVDFTTIPICLEAENATDYQLIDAL